VGVWIQILDLLEHKAIFSAGYKAILHLHSLVEECEITHMLAQIDVKTKEKKKVKLYTYLTSSSTRLQQK
jgi:peptide chain release factor subunit 3